MANTGSPEWLKEELTKALGWDAMFMEGVVQAICDATSKAELQDLTENFMGNDPKAASVIDTFLAARSGASQASGSSAASASASASGAGGPAGSSTAKPSYATSIRSAAPSADPPAAGPDANWQVLSRDEDEAKYAVSSGKAKGKLKKASDTISPRVEFGDEAGSSRQPEKALGMFKQGGRAPRAATKAAAGAAASGSRSKEERIAAVERKVANCLCCGKVYDCRSTSSDILRFLDREGACTFCGAMVALSYQDKSEERPANRAVAAAPGAATGAAAAAGAAGPGAGADDATAKAIAFKNRLVDYDRNSAKRTTVIDDQSDYFEVDSNAWLTEEERAELARRQKQEEEAAEARRRKVTFTIDLLGRRVVAAEEGEKLQQEREQHAAVAAAAAAGKGAKPGFAVPELPDELKVERAECGGGAAELQQTIAQLRNLKITANPTITMPAPVFLPRAQTLQPPGTAPAAAGGRPGQASASAGGGVQRPGSTGLGRGKHSGPAKGSMAKNPGASASAGAVQDDNIFDAFRLEMERGGRAGTVLSAADSVYD